MNQITFTADALLDACSRAHFNIKMGKSSKDILQEIRSVQQKAQRIESLIERELNSKKQENANDQ